MVTLLLVVYILVWSLWYELSDQVQASHNEHACTDTHLHLSAISSLVWLLQLAARNLFWQCGSKTHTDSCIASWSGSSHWLDWVLVSTPAWTWRSQECSKPSWSMGTILWTDPRRSVLPGECTSRAALMQDLGLQPSCTRTYCYPRSTINLE